MFLLRSGGPDDGVHQRTLASSLVINEPFVHLCRGKHLDGVDICETESFFSLSNK